METKPSYIRSINRMLIIFVVALGFFALHAGKSFIIPFAVALAIFFILNIFENLIKKIIRKILSLIIKKELSPRLNTTVHYTALISSLIISMFIIFSLSKAISANFDEMLSNAAKYQMLFNGKAAQFNNAVRNSQKHAEENSKPTPFQQIMSMIPEANLPVIDHKIISNINFNYILNRIGSFAGKGIANSTIIIVYLFFLYGERKNFLKKIDKITEKNVQFNKTKKIINGIGNDLVKYFTIKTIMSIITAVISYFPMYFFGLDFIWFWTFTIFILNYIPTIGSIVAVILPSLLGLIVFNNPIDAIFMMLILTVIQFIIGNVIEPKYQGDRLNLSPLIILLSLAVWGAIWGVVGMFLAVPIMVTINATLAQFETTKPLAMFFSSNGEIKD